MLAGSASQPSDGGWVIAADTREGFAAHLREVWQYRLILWFFSVRALRSLYKKTRLGVGWLFIRALLPLVVTNFVFGSIVNVASGEVPYFIFLLVGQLPWNCFDGPLVRASRGLDANRQLLTKVYVPRAILPLAQMTAGLIEPAINALMLIGAVVYYRASEGVWYVHARPQMLVAPACIFVILAFAFALSLWTSVWQARARDVRFVIRYIVSFWVYVTPVVYPLSQVPASIRWLAYLNPLTAPIETFKWALLPGLQHSWAWFGYSVAVTAAVFGAGAWYFGRSEHAMVDRL